MQRRPNERAFHDYEPYDQHYEADRNPAESELIDDSLIDPDLVERPFGRIRQYPQSGLLHDWDDYLNQSSPIASHFRTGPGRPR